MQRLRLINSIQNMLRIQNNMPEFNYTFLQRYSQQQLQQMMTGWQQNQPELFNTQGIYIL
jgi:guanylate kinase